eukprot:635629-Lingulodinium_polyedra.AAC.1
MPSGFRCRAVMVKTWLSALRASPSAATRLSRSRRNRWLPNATGLWRAWCYPAATLRRRMAR